MGFEENRLNSIFHTSMPIDNAMQIVDTMISDVKHDNLINEETKISLPIDEKHKKFNKKITEYINEKVISEVKNLNDAKVEEMERDFNDLKQDNPEERFLTNKTNNPEIDQEKDELGDNLNFNEELQDEIEYYEENRLLGILPEDLESHEKIDLKAMEVNEQNKEENKDLEDEFNIINNN